MRSLSGKLLVASPDLSGSLFARSVVLMIHHDADGAFGLILNRRGEDRLGSLWERTIHEACPVDLPVMIGGPLQGPLMAVHAEAALSEREILAGVHFAARKDLLESLVAAASLPMRVFFGYSGWGPGQLESELATGSWVLADATAELVFAEEETLWKRVSAQIFDCMLIETLRIKHVPSKPWHN
ncbi:MAG: YqgE/AlgH family protein [Planctomycetia bacterium]